MNPSKNSEQKMFETSLIKILELVSQNWNLASSSVTTENWIFTFNCSDDDGMSVGVSIDYSPKSVSVSDVFDWDDSHYIENVKIILSELKKLKVKNTDIGFWLPKL